MPILKYNYVIRCASVRTLADPDAYYTEWLDRDNESGTGDWEHISGHISTYVSTSFCIQIQLQRRTETVTELSGPNST